LLHRLAVKAIAVVAIAFVVFVAIGYRNATAAPVVRRLTVHAANYPSGAPATRIVLLSDIHVHGPDMPPSRVAAIADQVNALNPDIVVLAGDFIGDNWIGADYPIETAIAPLARLRATLGVYAVLGNNDYDAGAAAVVAALDRAGVDVLIDRAEAVGPIALGGIDGRILNSGRKWQRRRKRVFQAVASTAGVPVIAVHRPDDFRWAPESIPLMLAGHTHCGQIVLPLIGPLETGSDFGRRYLCGIIRKGPSTLIVTAGVGTSHLPLRFGAPPDMWLISIGR
jgi:predicted MPP superfamily phosphohydrolase